MLQDLDTRVLRYMRTRGHHPVAERAVKMLANTGEFGAVWTAGSVGAAAVDGERRSRWLLAAAVPITAIGVNFAIKVAVGRQRPKLRGLPPLGHAPTQLSFPSAHATSSFAAAAAMGRVAPSARPALFLGATAMGLTRPYLGMHYPSDVLAGAILGTVLGSLVPGLGGRPEPTTEERFAEVVARQTNGYPEAVPTK